jgi:hypothetical protein
MQCNAVAMGERFAFCVGGGCVERFDFLRSWYLPLPDQARTCLRHRKIYRFNYFIVRSHTVVHVYMKPFGNQFVSHHPRKVVDHTQTTHVVGPHVHSSKNY